LFTSNANSYFTETALKDFAAGLQPLGALQEFGQIGQGLRGGMTLRRYRAKFAQKTLRITTFWMPDGKLEQYQIAAAERVTYNEPSNLGEVVVPQELSEDIQGALFDLQRYLLDQTPPITAWDSIETLMGQPPELLMRQVHAWIIEQSRMQSAPVSDFIFHALKKIFMIGELKLIDRGAVLAYLDRIEPLALQICPESDRELLKTNLAAMRTARNITLTKVELEGQGGGGPAPERKAPLDADMAQTAKRFSLIIERLSRRMGDSKPTPQAVGQLVSLAAASSRNEAELSEYLKRVKPISGDTSDDVNLFKVLGDSLPSWDFVAAPKSAMQVKAMRKSIGLAADPMAGAKRLRELLTAAIDQFNAGNLSAAISMLELAEATIVEKKIDATTVERVRAEAIEGIRQDQLKKLAE